MSCCPSQTTPAVPIASFKLRRRQESEIQTEKMSLNFQKDSQKNRHHYRFEDGQFGKMTTKRKSLYPKPYGDPLNLREILGLKSIERSDEVEDVILNESHNFDIQIESKAEGSLQINNDPISAWNNCFLEPLDESNDWKNSEKRDDFRRRSESENSFIYCKEEESWKFYESNDLEEDSEPTIGAQISLDSINFCNCMEEKIPKLSSDPKVYSPIKRRRDNWKNSKQNDQLEPVANRIGITEGNKILQLKRQPMIHYENSSEICGNDSGFPTHCIVLNFSDIQTKFK